MTDGQVCCGCIVVHPDDDVEMNVAAADWRCWRRAYSCQQGSAEPCYLDTGGLSGRAWTWHDLPHRASASRRVEDVTVHCRTYVCRWRGELQRSWLVAVCPSLTSVHWRTLCCKSPPGSWQKRGSWCGQHSCSRRWLKTRQDKHICVFSSTTTTTITRVTIFHVRENAKKDTQSEAYWPALGAQPEFVEHSQCFLEQLLLPDCLGSTRCVGHLITIASAARSFPAYLQRVDIRNRSCRSKVLCIKKLVKCTVLFRLPNFESDLDDHFKIFNHNSTFSRLL